MYENLPPGYGQIVRDGPNFTAAQTLRPPINPAKPQPPLLSHLPATPAGRTRTPLPLPISKTKCSRPGRVQHVNQKQRHTVQPAGPRPAAVTRSSTPRAAKSSIPANSIANAANDATNARPPYDTIPRHRGEQNHPNAQHSPNTQHGHRSDLARRRQANIVQ